MSDPYFGSSTSLRYYSEQARFNTKAQTAVVVTAEQTEQAVDSLLTFVAARKARLEALNTSTLSQNQRANPYSRENQQAWEPIRNVAFRDFNNAAFWARRPVKTALGVPSDADLTTELTEANKTACTNLVDATFSKTAASSSTVTKGEIRLAITLILNNQAASGLPMLGETVPASVASGSRA